MSHQVDRVLDDMADAMKVLKQSLLGVPVRKAGFKRKHDQMARAVASLSVALNDSRAAIGAK